MKRIFLSTLIGVGLLTLIPLSGSEAARPPADYPLVCRGGGDLKPGSASGAGNVGFEFKRGTKPAGEELKEGSCSWTDRGMYEAEPNRVSQYIGDVPSAPKPAWYDELRSSDKYWTFMVSNDGKGQLIATSARPGGGEASGSTTTTFTPPAEGLRTFYVSHKWRNDRFNCENPFGFKVDIDDVPAGQVLVGYINDFYGGSGPAPCEWNSKNDYRGTIWFDLSEIYDKSFQIADKAILRFKNVEGSVAVYDAARKPISRLCEDELWVANADSMKGFTERVNNYSGDTHFPTRDSSIAAIKDCPPGGCSIDVTEVVNKWITGKIDRYGFVIVGEDEDWLDKLIPHGKEVCETRYSDFSLTVTYKSRTGLIVLPPTPPDKKSGPVPELARTNWALASNEGKASASSTLPSSLESYLNDGDRTGAGGKVWADNTINAFPDYVVIQLKRKRMIDEIDVYTRREDLTTPGDPTMSEEFSSFGITFFEVQYWDGSAWVTVPGGYAGRGKFAPSPNKKVWRQFTGFKVTTDQIRILIHASQDNNYSRVVEVEAWGT